ncbi:MAG TPA: hypothetical protein EYP10_13345, partial [Armatimonadetes bacterium]|nr:hypothetical protein [Armatimonadota bacterium]
MMWTREMAMRKDTHRISKAHAKRTYQPKLQPRACFATFVLMHILLFARGYAFSSQLQSLLTNGSFEEERVEWAPTTTTQRVEYPQAHSGRYCMRGEVTRPNQARFLNYAVDFNPDALYKVSLWAKSSNRNKLVLWIKIGDERRMVTVWTRTARAWRRYETVFSPPRAGKGEIQIIAPSSFGGPVGIMWVDDVQITVQPMPPNFRLTDGISINDYPTATLDGNGNLWIAWLHFSCAPDSHKNFEVRHPSEALHVACMPSDEIKRLIAGKSTSNVARRRARIALPSNVWVRDLHLVSLPSGTLLLYSMERGDNWDICAVQLNEDGATIKASEPTRLTVDSSTDIKPVGAVAPDDSLWLAWESNRGGARSIYVRQFDARTLKPISAVVRASRPDNNCYNPSIAIVAPSQDAGYEVWIVWDSFRNGTYDIYARVFDGRKWRSEMQLTNESPFNRHPIICASKDSVWIAWERGYVPRYHIGRYDQKQIHVAKFTGESLLAPNGLFNTPLMNWCEAPALAIDPAGRIWVIGRRSRGQHGAWDAVALCYSGAKWSKPIVLTARTGRARRIPIIATANGIVALVQIDNMPRTWSGRNLTAEWHSDIYACTVAYTEAPSPA